MASPYRRLVIAIPLAAALFSVGAAHAEPARIYAAGSLLAPLDAMIAASGIPGSDLAKPVYGPAGLLRRRIEAGEGAELFASADLAQAEALAGRDGRLPVVPFARNRLCVIAKGDLELDAKTLLDRLLDPNLRLATSTPGADPGGDYALAVFDRADRLKPGAGRALREKSLPLMGSPNAMVPVAGRGPTASIFLTGSADALLYYCSAAKSTLGEAPGLVSIPLPDALEVGPVYGLAVSGQSAAAMRLALFMLSPDGQAILAENGLLPIAGP